MSSHAIKVGATVALFGASSLAGSQALRQLARDGVRVRAGVDSRTPRWQRAGFDAETVEVSPGDVSSIRRLTREADALIYCDAYVPDLDTDTFQARRRGVRQVRRVLDACKREGLQRVVYLSSAGPTTYPAKNGVIDETAHYFPGTSPNPLWEARAAMEAELYRYIAAGMEIVILRPTLILGPGGFDDDATRLVAGLCGGQFPLLPADETINIVDARDLAKTTAAALRRGRPGRHYLVGGAPIGFAELVARIIEMAGQPESPPLISANLWRRLSEMIQRLPPPLRPSWFTTLDRLRQSYASTGSISNTRARHELGHAPRGVESTLRDTLDWLQRTGQLQRGSSPYWKSSSPIQ